MKVTKKIFKVMSNWAWRVDVLDGVYITSHYNFSTREHCKRNVESALKNLGVI